MKAGSPSADLGRTSELDRRIVDSSNDCIKVLDLEGRLLYLNQAGLELLGLSECDDILHTSWLDVWHDADRQAAAEAMARAKAGGAASFRGYCPTARGTPKWWDVVVTPITDAQGAVAQLLSVSRDITAWKQAEEALSESERRFRTIFAEAGTGIGLLDLAGTQPIQTNSALQSLLACSSEDLSLLDTFDRLTCPEDRERDALLHAELREGKRDVLRQEKHFVLSDGRHVWASVIFTLLRDAEGRPAHVIGMHEDITVRKRTEQALRESESRKNAILRALPDLMFLQTQDGTYIDYYTRDPQDLWVPPEQFLGKRMRDVLPASLAATLEQCFAEATSDEPRITEYLLPFENGTRHFEARVVRCGSDEFLSIIRDITDRTRAQAALRENECALRASYQQIQDLAGRLIEVQEAERTRIARDLHDDVSQQLAALSITLSQLRRRLRGAEQSPDVEDAVASLEQRTIKLAEQIRHLSHDLHPGMLQHAGLATALKAHCAAFAQQHRAHITFSAADDVGVIHPEVALCLYRIVQEALRNIARHASARSVRVALTRDADAVQLIVTDDGRGFDAAKVRQSGGGLGLLSIEERARLVRGTVVIDTHPGQGTTLHVRVPCGVPQLPDDAAI